MTDEFDLPSDQDDDELLAAWEAVDRQAAEVLQLACAEVLSEDVPASLGRAAADLRGGIERGGEPFDYFRNACGWQESVPAVDVELWLDAAASIVAPVNDPQMDVEDLGAIGGLEHVDWLALVVGLVRRGVGAEFDDQSWFADLSTLPEIEGEAPDDLQDYYEAVVETIAPLLEAVGALDADRRLTATGRWGLPQALLVAWGVSDEGPQLIEAETAVALEVLSERGAMTLEELRTELDQRGIEAEVDALERSLSGEFDAFDFDDDLWAHLPSLVEGAVLTHRLTAEEKDAETLDAALDLGLWDYLAMDPVPLLVDGEPGGEKAGAGEIRSHLNHRTLASPGISGLTGPAGWLGHFAVGEVLGLRYVGGALSLEHVQPVEDQPGGDELVALARRLAEVAAAQPVQEHAFSAVNSLDLAMTLLREHPGALTEPSAPWSELLTGSGLEVHGGNIGVPGTAWRVEPEWLEDDERMVYRAWLALLSADRLGQTSSPTELAALAAGLRGPVAELVAADLLADREREPLVVQMVEAATGAAAANPLYLRARAAEGAGDVLAMRDLLEAAVEADPTHEEALADLADLHAVAGEATEAARLYARAEVDPQAPEVHLLRPFLDPPASGPGRNKPCPCGSGKKYKVCHGRTDLHPIADRGAWLLAKVKLFLQRGVNYDALLGAALPVGNSTDDDLLAEAMGEALTWDLAVFDRGVLGAFQRLYAPLLPADESELLEQWAQSQRRLLQVTAVRESLGLTCRDQLTSEEFDVPDRLLSQELSPHQGLYGRLVDVGDGRPRFWDDPVDIPPAMMVPFTELLRDDPPVYEIAEFLSAVAEPDRQPDRQSDR